LPRPRPVACSGTGAAGGEGERAAADAPTSIEVTLTEFAIEPATLEAAAGSPLTFSISNDGAAPHTFAVTAGDETYETPSIAGALR